MPEPKEISEDAALQAYKRIIMPALGYIYEHYPILSVRNEFRNAIANMGSAEKEVLIHACGMKNSAWASTLPADENLSKPEVVFWMSRWIAFSSDEQVAQWPSFDAAKQNFEDTLVMVVCHEYYHAHNQKLWRVRPDLVTLDQLVNSESECWGYTCEKIIQPMIEGGRGPSPEEHAYSLNYAYTMNKFTRYSEGWKQVMRTWLQNVPD
ncbi:MAG: hypothetical protein HY979_03250 [Candidatus Magasanikbacteria bacterium]|nr:hypothetical protein [Candidatus Magasanikbacteria bacterium]